MPPTKTCDENKAEELYNEHESTLIAKSTWLLKGNFIVKLQEEKKAQDILKQKRNWQVEWQGWQNDRSVEAKQAICRQPVTEVR